MIEQTPAAPPPRRIAIIGVGQVGGAAAYALTMAGTATELLLVDIDVELREVQVHELRDTASCCGSCTGVRGANYKEAAMCDIIVITAGSKWTIGETSINFVYRNISIVRFVMDALRPLRADAIVLVVSNPVDLLTMIAQQLSGLPKSQIIGSGTYLDSARLSGVLAEKTKIAAKSIHISVLGVHGSSQVSGWSCATIGDMPLDKALSSVAACDDRNLPQERESIEDECSQRAHAILRAKGSIPFGVGAAVLSICTSIFANRGDIVTVSSYQPEFDCYLSLPVVVGRKGILRQVSVPLSTSELGTIRTSAQQLRMTLTRIREEE